MGEETTPDLLDTAGEVCLICRKEVLNGDRDEKKELMVSRSMDQSKT